MEPAKWEKLTYFENVGETFETAVGSGSRRCETGRNVREKRGQKAPAAGKPEEAEGNKGKREVEKRMVEDRGKGGRENAQRRDAAMRSSLDVTREKNIPRVKFRADVDVLRVCVCVRVCVETATTG